VSAGGASEPARIVAYSQIILELPDELLARVDRQVARIREHDFLVSRGNVIALLLGTALDDAEGRMRPGGRHPALRRLTSPVNQLVKELQQQKLEAIKTRRRQAEEEAARLHEVVPSLRELSLHVVRRIGEDRERRDAHTRHVIVDRAPAYFFSPCLDHDCVGGHDITGALLEGLREKQTKIVATAPCDRGGLDTSCAGVLEVEVTAQYEDGARAR
jgi:hypothetical protein